MAQKMWYLVSYDVKDPKRLSKTAKKMKGYGERIQYSVFRCRLTARQVKRMQWELKKIMDKEDNLLVIGLCDACVARIKKRKIDESWEQKIANYEIV